MLTAIAPGAPSRAAPWTNVYGLARTLLAVGTLVTLLANPADSLFRPLGIDVTGAAESRPLLSLSLFSLIDPGDLERARWFSIALLALVASGWRPRFTGPLHWWVSFSFVNSAVVIDGGDQITAVLALLLLPVTLTDPRRWHWSDPPSVAPTVRRLTAIVAGSATIAVRVQVSVIYLHAAVGKFGVAEWINGTALYYWMVDHSIGLPYALRPFLMPILVHPLLIMTATWGVLVLETLLAMGVVMDRRHRRYLLFAGLLFHAAIIVAHGLLSFFFAMAGALVIYLVPTDQQLTMVRNLGPARPVPVVEGERA